MVCNDEINQLVDTWDQHCTPFKFGFLSSVSSGGGSDSDSSSSSSSEDEDRHGHRASKRIDRAERRRVRAERKGRRRGRGGLGVPEYRRGRSHDDHLGRGSGSRKDRWRVFITSV